jgi:hypothetical protein
MNSRWLPWLAGVVLVAGIAASLVVFLGDGDTGKKTVTPVSSSSTQRPSAKRVPLAAATTLVSQRFILTAVARKKLGAAYDLVGPELKQGMSRAEWARGEIPVVPYPVSPNGITAMKVDLSEANHALLEVTLVPRSGDKTKPQLFAIELRARGKGKARHWLVVGWVPLGAPPILRGG